MIQWISESMNQWLSEWTVGWMNEWNDGRWESYTSFLSYTASLSTATYSLRYLFSQLLLLWAACYLGYFFFDPALSCLPAHSSVASAAQLFSSCSCCNAFSNPQLQSRIRIALWSKTTFRAAVTTRLATSSCKLPEQERHSTTTTKPNRPTFAQRHQRWPSHTNPGLPRMPKASVVSRMKSFSGHRSSSKSAPHSSFGLHVEVRIELSLYSPDHFFVDNFPKPRKERPCFGDPRSHYTCKNTAFVARVFSPMNSRAPGLLHFPQLLGNGWLTWWCVRLYVVDIMVWMLIANHDHRP